MGASTATSRRLKPQVHLVACVSGVFASLIIYSLAQERLMTEPFGNDGEIFKFSLFLVLANRIISLSVAVLALGVQGLNLKPVAPFYKYAAVSASNVVATTCQYEALKHVSFPVQTLGKCAKMIPVMLWGTLIARKSYRVADYALAAAVTTGCTLFLTSGEVKSKAAGETSHSSLWGVLLMLAYLMADGFTSTFQSKLFRGYQMSVHNQILYTTLFSAAFSFTGLVSSGQLGGALGFVRRHPASLNHILLLSAASTSGQLCIVHTVKAFGPLLLAGVMTTRQFASILLSCIVFVHPLTRRQWVGTALVFGALLFKTLRPPQRPQGRQDPRLTTNPNLKGKVA